jgi:fructokinase
LLAFATREAGILDTWQGPPCLTHGDCGGSNILVLHQASELLISGIIDWEFSFSGTPFFDLGNILRAPLGGLPGFVEGLADGYRGASGVLPENWRGRAAMTDLLAWVESSLRARVSEEFLHSARQEINETIAGWRGTAPSP